MQKNNFTETINDKLIESHTFWSQKRLLFNILVGISGLIGLVLVSRISFNFFDVSFIIVGSFLWGLVANGLYSLGFEIDSLIIYKTNGLKSIGNNKSLLLFWTGTITYMLSSFCFIFLINVA